MKICNIYHSRDLDGWMSAAIVKKWFIEEYSNIPNTTFKTIEGDTGDRLISNHNQILDLLSWDYGDLIPDLSNYDKVIMCDISFSRSIMIELLNKYDNNLIWIDHHFGAIRDIVGIHHINKEGVDVSTAFNGIRHSKFAACELTWKYFFPNEEIPEIVRLLGRYDCFGHKGTKEEQKVLEFQYGARQVISNYKEAYLWLKQEINELPNTLIDDTVLYILWNKGKSIYQYLCTEAKQIYKKALPIKLLEENNSEDGTCLYYTRKFLCVNQERFNPINFGINYHKEGYDGFACFWLKDSKWNFSLYNDNGNVDCSIIAKEYKGGGHKGAAGFIVDFNELSKIINEQN